MTITIAMLTIAVMATTTIVGGQGGGNRGDLLTRIMKGKVSGNGSSSSFVVVYCVLTNINTIAVLTSIYCCML